MTVNSSPLKKWALFLVPVLRLVSTKRIVDVTELVAHELTRLAIPQP
jgi:hypothetical protein